MPDNEVDPVQAANDRLVSRLVPQPNPPHGRWMMDPDTGASVFVGIKGPAPERRVVEGRVIDHEWGRYDVLPDDEDAESLLMVLQPVEGRHVRVTVEVVE